MILQKPGIERGREEGRIEGIRAIIHLAELVNLGKNETIQQLAEGMHMTTEESKSGKKKSIIIRQHMALYR